MNTRNWIIGPSQAENIEYAQAYGLDSRLTVSITPLSDTHTLGKRVGNDPVYIAPRFWRLSGGILAEMATWLAPCGIDLLPDLPHHRLSPQFLFDLRRYSSVEQWDTVKHISRTAWIDQAWFHGLSLIILGVRPPYAASIERVEITRSGSARYITVTAGGDL